MDWGRYPHKRAVNKQRPIVLKKNIFCGDFESIKGLFFFSLIIQGLILRFFSNSENVFREKWKIRILWRCENLKHFTNTHKIYIFN